MDGTSSSINLYSLFVTSTNINDKNISLSSTKDVIKVSPNSSDLWIFNNNNINFDNISLNNGVFFGYSFDNGDVYHLYYEKASIRGNQINCYFHQTKNDQAKKIEALSNSDFPAIFIIIDSNALTIASGNIFTSKYEMKNLNVKFVPGKDELFSRNKGLIELDTFATRCVSIIGLGSGGSPIAIDLAKAGVGKFILVDNDRLELANVVRHSCDIKDLGRLKVHAMRDAILARNPYCEVITSSEDCCENFLEIINLLEKEKCDLIVAATDSEKSRNILNEMALRLNIPAIFGRTIKRASSGDVLRVPRGGHPCLRCVFSKNVNQPKSDLSAGDLVAYQNPGDHVVVHPGLATDIAPISNLMTKLCLIELSRTNAIVNENSNGQDKDIIDSTGMIQLDNELSGNFFKWSNRREEEESDQIAPFGIYGSIVPLGNDHAEKWYSIGENNKIEERINKIVEVMTKYKNGDYFANVAYFKCSNLNGISLSFTTTSVSLYLIM